jgi:hypothetical protein
MGARAPRVILCAERERQQRVEALAPGFPVRLGRERDPAQPRGRDPVATARSSLASRGRRGHQLRQRRPVRPLVPARERIPLASTRCRGPVRPSCSCPRRPDPRCSRRRGGERAVASAPWRAHALSLLPAWCVGFGCAIPRARGSVALRHANICRDPSSGPTVNLGGNQGGPMLAWGQFPVPTFRKRGSSGRIASRRVGVGSFSRGPQMVSPAIVICKPIWGSRRRPPHLLIRFHRSRQP